MNDSHASQLLEEQRRRWRQGERVKVEAYLEQQPGLSSDRTIVLDLIYNEILLREEEGDRPRQEEYLTRFPHLTLELRQQFEVDGALNTELLGATGTSPESPANAIGPTPFPTLPGYEILEVIGRGGMGVVYKARHLALDRLVAVKMILVGVSDETARFRSEAEVIARLQHPNIVSVYDAGVQDGRPYISLELADSNLLTALAGAPAPVGQAAQWLETLTRAVHYAHQHGIVHRDLKPANVLLSRDGTLKITDFGTAKIFAAQSGPVTHTGAIMGTPAYMAPEQAAGKSGQIGPATDIYGLGTILYELLTGRPPFPTSDREGAEDGVGVFRILEQVRLDDPVPPRRLQPQVPRDLETICLRCLHKDPAGRYSSAAELAGDVSAFLAGAPIHSRRAGPIERLSRWGRRRPAEAVLLATTIITFAALLAGIVWSHVLAAAVVAGMGLLLGSGWYNAGVQKALAEARAQQIAAERAAQRLQLLLEMTRRLMRTNNLEDLLRLLAETTVWLADAESATIYLLDRERGELWAEVTMGAQVGQIRLPLGVGIAGTVAQTGEPLNVADPYADARFNPAIDRRSGRKTRNLLTLPVTGRDGAVIGVFQAVNKRTGPFSVEDMAILSAFADSAAIAVEQALPGQAQSLSSGPQP